MREALVVNKLLAGPKNSMLQMNNLIELACN